MGDFDSEGPSDVTRRSFLQGMGAAGGAAAVGGASFASAADMRGEPPIPQKDDLKITELEAFKVQPRWLFLKVHTNAGITGLGEPIVEGRADTV